MPSVAMTDRAQAWHGLRHEIAQARATIGDRHFTRFEQGQVETQTPTLGSVLAECQNLILPAVTPVHAPVRLVHHFACTGGTLIARCLGVMPNVHLQSEVDPLSTQLDSQRFRPTDLGFLARTGTRPVDRATVLRIFHAGLDVVLDQAGQLGRHVVLRDHAHSQYCVGDRIPDRPTLRAIVATAHPVLSLVSLRHPLDSYLSLQKNAWVHFTAQTLEEYAHRMTRFLDDHKDLPQIRYEDILADPAGQIQMACQKLRLRFNPAFGDLIADVTLSGDSGRKGSGFTRHPRRPVPDDIARQAATSPTYTTLCARLGYNPDPGAPALAAMAGVSSV